MIQYTLSKPLALSLYRHLREDIENGIFPAETKLPSKRQLALDLQLSLSTVEKSLSLLEQEGYIVCLERRGYFVCKGNEKKKQPDQFHLKLLDVDPVKRDLSFPASLWFKTMRLVMSRDENFILQRSPRNGSSRLRNCIALYLHLNRHMNVQPEQIIIAASASQLYALLCRMFKGSFKVAIESPGYPIIEEAYHEGMAEIEKLPLDADGIELNALQNSKSQFLHVSPFMSFPLPVRSSPYRRRYYLQWIYQKDGYLIEDDFNSEFFQNGPVLQTLFALDDKEKVIYLNTFSKSISSSVRLAYMVLPSQLLSVYEERAGSYSCAVTMLEQYTLAEFIENGSLERLIMRRRRAQQKATDENF